MSNQVLERFHRALIEEIQTQRPDYLTSPFTVAEIYQNLVPYGSHRDRIGVEMNGDYEDALIRLLAGEGEYLVLDSEAALRALQAEVQSSNPNTGIYRDFAAADVRLNPAHVDLSADTMDQLVDLSQDFVLEDPVAMTSLAPSTSPAGQVDIVPPGAEIFPDGEPAGADEVETGSVDESTELAPEFVEAESGPASPAEGAAAHDVEPVAGSGISERAAGADEDAVPCRWCNEALPVRSPMNFCPFCGRDQKVVPCGSCGSELEPDWHFCASCGSSTDT